MIIKKFTGKTEDDALKEVRAELGAQAVIMNVKRSRRKVFLVYSVNLPLRLRPP